MNRSIQYLAALFITCMTALSCTKDVSLDPTTFRPVDYTTEVLLNEQVAGMYNILEQDQLYGQGIWGYLTAGADESFRANVTSATIFTELYNIANTENNVWQFWRNLYKGVEDANIILNVADKPAMDENKRRYIKGQAIFLRAYYFYLLALHFGDVPLKTQMATELGTNFNLPRTPRKEVYDFVFNEMVKAESMVQTIPQTQTTTIVTQSAVQAILARVCLTMAGNPINDAAKYKDALFWAKKLISSNIHGLNPSYATLFINNMQNNINDKNILEGIWDAAFLSKSNTTGSFATTAYLVTQTLGAVMGVYCPDASPAAVIGYSSGTYRVFPRLYNSYAPGDLRRDWAVAPYVYKNTTTTKYYTLSVNITGGGGTGASATAYTSATGAITSIVVDNPGSGYTSAPAISFSAYGTNTTTTQAVTGANVATATATVSGGQVTGISVTFGGAGYPTTYDRCVGKWRREYEINLPPTRLQNNTSCNFPIVRYADVLLMAAEADLKVNGSPSAEAVGYYNQVRRRAYGFSPLTPAPSVDVTTFTLQDIMDERSRELCFEGQRRNDLIRWGVMTTAMQNLITDNANRAPATYLAAVNVAATNFVSAPDKYVLFPIAAGEIALDKALVQNPGW